MKTTGFSSLRGWKAITLVLGMAGIFLVVFAVRPALAGQSGQDMTQAEYLQWLSKAHPDKASLPDKPTTADLVKWAVDRGIEPEGGWKPDALLSRDAFAQTLAQVYAVPTKGDPARALEREGVVIPKARIVSRAAVTDVFNDVGFQSRTAVSARHPGTPIGPRPKVVICHRPPGNPGKPVTIVVAESAVPAHLAHGDSLGPCP